LLISKANCANFSYALSLFEKPKYPANFSHFDYVNLNSKQGGTIKFATEGSFNSLNPFLLKGLPAEGLSYLYDTLTENSEDELGVRYGLVAKEIKLEQHSIEFKINKTAYFHDYVPITAEDVFFTFETLLKYGHPVYQMQLKQIKKVKIINKYQIKFEFQPNHIRDLALFIASLPVLPKHYYQKHSFYQTTLQPPIGSGPYKITEIKPNYHIIYRKNDNYWAKNLPVNKGKYNFHSIWFDYYRDNNVLIEAFKAQKYDFRQENIARNWATAYNFKENNNIIKTEINHSLPSPMQAFIFNLRKPKFQNIALRQAMNYAFDFLWLQHHIFYDSYQKTTSFFPNSVFGYKNFSLPNGSKDGFNRKNLLQAQEILSNAGYKVVNNQLFDINKQPVIIEFLIDNKAFEMVVASFAYNLKKLGIKAKIKFAEENQYQQMLNNFNFDIIVNVFPQSTIPGAELYSYFHSSQSNIKGSRNLLGLQDKKIDSLVEKISITTDKNKIIQLCQQLDKYLLTNYFVIPHWYNNTYRILYRNIFAIPKNKPKYSLALDSWSIL
jgi:microcin C transport system substrate-binding protein